MEFFLCFATFTSSFIVFINWYTRTWSPKIISKRSDHSTIFQIPLKRFFYLLLTWTIFFIFKSISLSILFRLFLILLHDIPYHLFNFFLIFGLFKIKLSCFSYISPWLSSKNCNYFFTLDCFFYDSCKSKYCYFREMKNLRKLKLLETDHLKTFSFTYYIYFYSTKIRE